MRTLTFIATILVALFFNSCSESCSCKKYCVLYNKDSVVVCQTALGAENISPEILDSLTNRYGPASDTIQTDLQLTKALQAT